MNFNPVLLVVLINTAKVVKVIVRNINTLPFINVNNSNFNSPNQCSILKINWMKVTI